MRLSGRSASGQWVWYYPIHQQPQCEQCRKARRGVAHCRAWGHVGHPVVVVGATASSQGLHAWLVPPDLASTAKRPCLSPTAAVSGRHPQPDSRSPSPPTRRGRVLRTLPWVPPPPLGIQRTLERGANSNAVHPYVLRTAHKVALHVLRHEGGRGGGPRDAVNTLKIAEKTLHKGGRRFRATLVGAGLCASQEGTGSLTPRGQ